MRAQAHEDLSQSFLASSWKQALGEAYKALSKPIAASGEAKQALCKPATASAVSDETRMATKWAKTAFREATRATML